MLFRSVQPCDSTIDEANRLEPPYMEMGCTNLDSYMRPASLRLACSCGCVPHRTKFRNEEESVVLCLRRQECCTELSLAWPCSHCMELFVR